MLEGLRVYGPLPGLLLLYIEAFIPALPLMGFVALNVNVYGFWFGILWSWLGVVAGATSVFFIARRFGGRFGVWLQRKYPKSKKFFNYLEHKSFTPIFILACLPFSPSVLINIGSGISKVPWHSFVTSICMGKFVFIITIALISFDFDKLLQEPWRIALSVTFLAMMWLIGRKIDKHYDLK
jgi:uncharacterized membrane protein YdjX (TVP38/TMEM64 family)